MTDKKPMKPHVPAKIKDPIKKSKHKLERVKNPSVRSGEDNAGHKKGPYSDE